MSKFSPAPLLAALWLMAGPADAAAPGVDGGTGSPPAYRTVFTDGNFEVRDYPARRLAEFSVVGDQAIAAYQGFRVFADPLFKGQASDERATLASPVEEAPAPSEQFSHYSLFNVESARVWTVSFDPPPGWAPGDLGYRNAPDVRWREAPAERMAVLRYDGRGGVWDPGLGWRDAAKQLLIEVARHHLKPAGQIRLAQYNSPLTPQVFRHYAVMVPVKD
ncbi:MAG: heme-binding protein [Alphaproteobacteria bacterium]|nr:heme-binding protein [Alphaproteobacteria bacterium]